MGRSQHLPIQLVQGPNRSPRSSLVRPARSRCISCWFDISVMGQIQALQATKNKRCENGVKFSILSASALDFTQQTHKGCNCPLSLAKHNPSNTLLQAAGWQPIGFWGGQPEHCLTVCFDPTFSSHPIIPIESPPSRPQSHQWFCAELQKRSLRNPPLKRKPLRVH